MMLHMDASQVSSDELSLCVQSGLQEVDRVVEVIRQMQAQIGKPKREVRGKYFIELGCFRTRVAMTFYGLCTTLPCHCVVVFCSPLSLKLDVGWVVIKNWRKGKIVQTHGRIFMVTLV